MLSRGLILTLISLALTACGGGSGGSGGGAAAPDTNAPAAPVALKLDASSDTGVSATDRITSDKTPTFSGTGGVAGNTVKLYANGTEVGSGVVSGNGSWSVTSSVLADNSYSITARYINAESLQSAASAALSPVVIDTAAPAAPLASNQGAAGVGGTAGVGDIITLYDESNVQVTQTSADNAGNWSIAASSFPNQTALGFSGSVKAMDLAGNESTGTAVGPITAPESSLVTGRIVNVVNASVCTSVLEAD